MPETMTRIKAQKRMDISELVREFYVTESLSAVLGNPSLCSYEAFRHSHEKWREDFDSFHAEFTEQLATAIYDYTAVVVAGELRHSMARATKFIEDYPDAGIGRSEVYAQCTRWTPDSILRAGTIVFDPSHIKWDSGYGGKKWWQIAKGGMYRHKLSTVAFIDHCVDLSHNNSVYFDKGANIFWMSISCSEYMQYLDFKRTASLDAMFSFMCVGRRLKRLIDRARTIGILTSSIFDTVTTDDDPTIAEDALFEYSPIVWGTKELKCTLLPSSEYRDSSDEDDNEDSDESDDEEEYEDEEHDDYTDDETEQRDVA